MNGNAVDIPENYRGDIQADRDNFFGMIEVPVPFEYLKAGNNTVELSFRGTDGFVSSCALQVCNFSQEIYRNANNVAGINNTLAFSQAKIYPNPVNDNLSIEGDIDSWKIFSMSGCILQHGNVKTIQMSHFAPGNYLLQLDNKETQIFTKI